MFDRSIQPVDTFMSEAFPSPRERIEMEREIFLETTARNHEAIHKPVSYRGYPTGRKVETLR